MFQIELSNLAKKFLRKADKELCGRIIRKIKELSVEPFPSDCKRVVGRQEKVFRVRVGSYRVLYAVFPEVNKIFISDIDKRPKVYK